ncbi:MAG: spore maturation protein [Bacillota bacterium]|nr:spore maturation protein [Bacillota bacterium]
MDKIGNYIIPAVIFIIIIFGFIKKVPVFDAFLSGAKQGLKATYMMAGALIGLITAVSMLKASGALDLITNSLMPVAQSLGFPAEILPMAIMRPISGSGSTALLNQILKDHGPDSTVGMMASVISGSSETTFYAIAVYYGSAGVKKIRHTIPAALLADFASAVMAVLSVKLFFGG